MAYKFSFPLVTGRDTNARFRSAFPCSAFNFRAYEEVCRKKDFDFVVTCRFCLLMLYVINF